MMNELIAPWIAVFIIILVVMAICMPLFVFQMRGYLKEIRNILRVIDRELER